MLRLASPLSTQTTSACASLKASCMLKYFSRRTQLKVHFPVYSDSFRLGTTLFFIYGVDQTTTSKLPKMFVCFQANPTCLVITASISLSLVSCCGTRCIISSRVHLQSSQKVTVTSKYLFVNSLWPPQKINKTLERSVTWLSVSRINFVLIFSCSGVRRWWCRITDGSPKLPNEWVICQSTFIRNIWQR